MLRMRLHQHSALMFIIWVCRIIFYQEDHVHANVGDNIILRLPLWHQTHNTLLQYYTTTIMHYCTTARLQYYSTTLLHTTTNYIATPPDYYTTTLRRHYATTRHFYTPKLLHYHATTPQQSTTARYYTTALLHYYATTLLHWCTTTLLHYDNYTNAIQSFYTTAQCASPEYALVVNEFVAVMISMIRELPSLFYVSVAN